MQRNDTHTMKRPADITTGEEHLHIRLPALTALQWWGFCAKQEFPAEEFDLRQAAAIEQQSAADPTLAALIEVARQHLAGDDDAWYRRKWACAVALRDANNELEPRPMRELYVEDPTDTCRHGRLFAETCDDCGP